MAATRRFLIVLMAVVFSCTAAHAQQTMTLALKGEKGRIDQYKVDLGGTLSFQLDGLPIPNSKLSGENLKASVAIDTYFDTLDVQPEAASYNIKIMIKKIILGGLMQLPDMGGSENYPEVKMDLTPQGGMENVEVTNLKLPGMDMLKGAIPGAQDMGLDMSSLDSIMPMIVGLFPPVFPKDPVAVGDSWSQKPGADSMPLPIFPVIEFKYKLDSVDNGVAKILFKSKGKYDAGFIKNFLSMIPEIPMGDDAMSIKDIEMNMNWDIDGTMFFVLDKGIIKDVKATGVVNMDGGGKMVFTHQDGSVTPWEPKLQGKMDLEGGLTYVGAVARTDYEALFPPKQEEEKQDESGAAESGGEGL